MGHGQSLPGHGRRVLVTGATGFVGRAVCRRLARDGWSIIAALRTAREVPGNVEPVLVGSLSGATCWPIDALRRVDAVVHLAAHVHQLGPAAVTNEEMYTQVNVDGTRCLAEAAAAAGVLRFVFVSSLHAVAETSTTTLNEQSPCVPQSAYGRSKRAAELALYEMSGRTGLPVTILRPPPVYGRGQVGRLGRLLAHAARGWPLPVGGLAARRSLVYVENLADAIVTSLTHAAAVDQTYIVTDGEATTLPELVRRAARAARRRPWVVPAPQTLLRWAGRVAGRTTAVERLLGGLAADSTKICRELDWPPPFTLDAGLQATLARTEGEVR